MSDKNPNESVLKAIKWNDDMVTNEQKKIAKMKSIRDELVKAYKFQCHTCEEYSYLKDYLFVQYYSVDMDSDYHNYNFENCVFECPKCEQRFDNRPDKELIDILGKHPTISKYCKVKSMEGGKGW